MIWISVYSHIERVNQVRLYVIVYFLSSHLKLPCMLTLCCLSLTNVFIYSLNLKLKG